MCDVSGSPFTDISSSVSLPLKSESLLACFNCSLGALLDFSDIRLSCCGSEGTWTCLCSGNGDGSVLSVVTLLTSPKNELPGVLSRVPEVVSARLLLLYPEVLLFTGVECVL